MKRIGIKTLLTKAYSNPDLIIHKAYIELTHQCNFKCVHCYNREESKLPALSLKDYRKFALNLRKLGALHIVLTGGEPLLNINFVKIYLLLRKLGFFVTIMTNGSLLDSKLINMFCEFPPKAIEISIYGFSEETSKRVTGSKYSCPEFLLPKIIPLINANIPVYIKSVIMRSNYNDLISLQKFAIEYGLKFRYDVSIHPRLDCSFKSKRERLRADAAIDAESRNKKLMAYCQKKNCHSQIKKTKSGMTDTANGYRLFNCGIGKYSLVLDPYGYMHPCLLVRHTKQWHVSSVELSDLFLNHFAKKKDEQRKKYLPCDDCRYINECNYCGGMYLLFKKKSDSTCHYCEIIKARFKNKLPDRGCK